MSHKVDIEEADVAVLNQNIVQSKELFDTISKSLTQISKRSSNASTKIKPILRDVNKLTYNKQQIEQGLELLNEVSNYAASISKYESILNNSIDIIGCKKFLDTLIKSKLLLKEMKLKIRNFRGIIINFDNCIEKSQINLVNYFKKILAKLNIMNFENSFKINQDIFLILKFFYGNTHKDSSDMNNTKLIESSLIRSLSQQLLIIVKPLEKDCRPVQRTNNVPYERGTNGINKFTDESIKLVKIVSRILQEINTNADGLIDQDLILKESVKDLINGEYSNLLLNNYASNNEDLLGLEIVENIINFEKALNISNLDSRQFPKFKETTERFINNQKAIFKNVVSGIESRIIGVDKLNDKNIPELIVESISKIRRISEYKVSLLRLIRTEKLGSWLNCKPPLRFIGVYTSVIPITLESGIDESSAEFLLSSYLSDLIDAIMINLEINIKNDNHSQGPNNLNNLKKSTQGYYLIKNLILIETIVNRSQQLFASLGNIGIERINKLKNRFLKLFLDDWNYASYIIIRDMTAITTTNVMQQQQGNSHGALSNKEKEQIKDLFKNFNESFEEALKNYEKFNINDANLRNYLKNEIKKLILNAYFKLYDKYGNGDFTKNKSKYVKYDKNQFESLLNQKL